MTRAAIQINARLPMATSRKSPEISAELMSKMLLERNSFHLNNILSPKAAQGITVWEEVRCIGFNPEQGRIEAIVDIKQSTGYGGGLCTPASLEYVRFYVDFKDGSGFVDVGLTSFKAADISNAPPGLQHPLSYMAQLPLDDEKHRRFTDCHTAVIPTLRAILSWNNPPPPATPGFAPFYGNVRDADIQLRRKPYLVLSELPELVAANKLIKMLDLETPIPFKPPVPPLAATIHETNKRAGVPDHRTFYATVGAAMHSPMNFAKAKALFDLKDLAALKVDVAKLMPIYAAKPKNAADVSFEEVTCVGLKSDSDTIGAVVHIKKSSGYNGDLCHTGSMEHVAFWADWNNNGTFDQYLGTVSFETHDINNIPAGGLYYDVSLPIDVSNRLKSCEKPNIIRIRAVLSWESLPSTTDPNQLNTWGNWVDALVQLRPGRGTGMHSVITYVGEVDRTMIDPVQHLYNYNAVAPSYANNRPWGGAVVIRGIIDRNGFNGQVKFRLSCKPHGAPDSAYLPVTTSDTFRLWEPLVDPIHAQSDPQTADADGWYVYKPNPALEIFSWDYYLGYLQTRSLADGHYTIRFEYTDEFANPVVGDVFSIVVCNQGMKVSPTPNAAVDMGADLDLVIDDGDCAKYDAKFPVIHGHLRCVHPYFGWWSLELQPASHVHSGAPVPLGRSYSAAGDTGDANAPWSLDTTPLDSCGYTVSLHARSRVILDSSPGYFPYYGPKAVGFAKLP
jgi:hypothetical protein